MNKERQHRIFVEPWSDSIDIALWRNDGFLHLFHVFSKSNAFCKNLKRAKFILKKFLSNDYTFEQQNVVDVLQFALKLTLLDFQLIIIITVTIQVAVLNRFLWNSHGWCEFIYGWHLIFLETIDQIEPLIWGKVCPQNWFFGFHSTGIGVFWEKHFKTVFVVQH